MAELHVVKKRKSPFPWILLLLLVLGLLAYFLLRNDTGVTRDATTVQDSTLTYDTSRQGAP